MPLNMIILGVNNYFTETNVLITIFFRALET